MGKAVQRCIFFWLVKRKPMSLALAWAGAGLALGWAGLALGWAGAGLGSRWDWVATGPRTHSPVAQWLLRGSLPRSMSPNDTTHQICPSPKELAIIYQRAPRVLASICLQNRPTEPIVQIPSRDSSPVCAEQLPQRACNHLPRRTPPKQLARIYREALFRKQDLQQRTSN